MGRVIFLCPKVFMVIIHQELIIPNHIRTDALPAVAIETHLLELVAHLVVITEVIVQGRGGLIDG